MVSIAKKKTKRKLNRAELKKLAEETLKKLEEIEKDPKIIDEAIELERELGKITPEDLMTRFNI